MITGCESDNLSGRFGHPNISATRNGALAIGIEHTTGTIQKGKIADLVLLSDDPSRNIDNIDQVELVIKNGKLYNVNK